MGTVLIDWSTIDWKKVTKRTVPIGFDWSTIDWKKVTKRTVPIGCVDTLWLSFVL